MKLEELIGEASTHLVSASIGQKIFSVHPSVVTDLLNLKQAADQAGFNLHIASGFRSFERQLAIWNGKMSGDIALLGKHGQKLDITLLSEEEKINSILRWSALPGGSRHHWGTDFDVYDRGALSDGTVLKLESWEYLQGHQKHFYHWLKHNLTHYGFFFPYTEKSSGVGFEPWHISHHVSSNECLKQLNVEMLYAKISSSNLIGKQGVLTNINDIYRRYINIKS
jgi:LAS superfamily LD-carboxypeptidase LdcB